MQSPLTQVAQVLRLAKKQIESDSKDVVGMVSVSSGSVAVRLCVLDSLRSVRSDGVMMCSSVVLVVRSGLPLNRREFLLRE